MGAILPILVALNIIFASVAGPVFIAGVGLGSGTAGSSWSQRAQLTNIKQLEAAFLIFKHSCDPIKWEGSPYPTSAKELEAVINNKSLLADMANGQSSCVPLIDGKSGIIEAGGNAVEMASLLSGHWDVRVLESVYYLIVKRFQVKNALTGSLAQNKSLLADKAQAATTAQTEEAGYQEKCDYGDKSAPFLTIRVTAGYMDINGQPTALARSADEDDPEATQATNNAISPHGRGQAVDFLSVGCTVIKKDGDIQQVIPNNLASGQENTGTGSAPGIETADTIAQQSSYPDPELMDPAAQEIFENNDDLYTSGIDQAQREGMGAELEAAEVVDPDIQPEILPPSNPSQGTTSYAQKAAQMAERVIEKKYSLPSGSLSLGANAGQIGRAALYSQTGIFLSDSPSAKEITEAATKLEKSANPAVTLRIPPQAIALLRGGQADKFFNLVGINRINSQFSQNWSDTEVAKIVQSGLSSDELVQILKKDIPTQDPQDEQMLVSLSTGGYKDLAKNLEKQQEEQTKTVSGSLANALQNVNQLNKNQTSALGDFTNPSYRAGVTNQLKALKAPQQLIDWVNNHQNLSVSDQKNVDSIISQYTSSENGKEKIKNQQGDVFTNMIDASVKLMKPDEQVIFKSVIGSNPSSDNLKAAFSDGRIEKASEAVIYSKTLRQLGIPLSQTTYLAIGVASGKMDGSTAGLNLFNQTFSQYGVKFSKNDFALAQNGQFPAAGKLALGLISQKANVGISLLQSAFGGKAANLNPVVAAITKSSALSSQVTGMLNGLFAKPTDSGASLSHAAATAGAKAKAAAIAAGISSGTDAATERAQNADKIEKGLNESINGSGGQAQAEATNLLVDKGLSTNDSKKILAGEVKGAESSASVNFIAKNLASRGYGNQADIAKVLSGKATSDQKLAMSDTLARSFLQEQNINIATPISNTILKGTDEQRLVLAKDIGTQYAANQIIDQVQNTTGLNIVITSQQAGQFAKGNLKALGDVANTSARDTAANQISDAMGGNIPAGAIEKIYDSAISDGRLDPGEQADLGWGIVEDNFGFSKDAVSSFSSNLQNLPQNYIDSFNASVMQTQLTGIGAGIIVNKLLGNTLAKIDPTGGLLSSFAMQYATQYIMSLGLSMPLILGIAFILDPAATIQAIKGMVMMALSIFTDPIGTIMGLFGFGKKKPKAESAVTNPTNSGKDTIKDPGGFIDSPTDNNPNSAIAFAADPATNSSKAEIKATSDYLPPKKPTKEYLQKIARRTTDQTVEDLLLMGVVFSANRQLQKAQPDFIQNHWTRYMGSSPTTLSYAIKQLVSPRAPVLKDKQASAKKAGIKDFLYEKEQPGGEVGLDFTINLSKLVFGSNSSPLNNNGRVRGLDISSNIYSHVHLSF